MKKLFLAICFSFLICSANTVFADAVLISDVNEIVKKESQPRTKIKTDDIKLENMDDVDDFLGDRIRKVVITKLDDETDSVSSMGIEHSEEYIAQQQENNKPIYQKIYEKALARVSASGEGQRDDVAPKRQLSPQEQAQMEKEWLDSLDFDVINIQLPFSEGRILAPASEHIPYLFTDIEVLPTGTVSINETIMVVANGDKLKHGLTKILPKYSISRSGEKNKINVNLISVTINGTEVPYKLKETDTDILIIPQNVYELPNGVYNYNFKYMIDRRLWYYDDFNELYWDITGSAWNMVIARAGAMLKLPNGNKPIGQTLLIGYFGELSNEYALINKADENTIGFVSKRPLFMGEGMHILASLPKEGFEPITFSKKFDRFIDDYGDVIFSALALLAIIGSYFLSWKSIVKKSSKQKYSLGKNAPMLRYLINGKFDKISFVSFLLELFRKNIIDIQKTGHDILLVKKTDALSGLKRREKKAVENLFVNHESVLNVNTNNALKVQRAYNMIEKETLKRFKNFTLKLNLGYLFFSVGMLLAAEGFISWLSVDTVQTFAVLFSANVAMSLYLWIWDKKFDNRYINRAVKTFVATVILFTIFVTTIFVHFIATLLIFAMIYGIFSYTKLFAKRTGLIKNSVVEAQEYKEMLVKNKPHIVLSRDFLNQQANIFALDLADGFAMTDNIKDIYRLDLAKEILSRI